MAEPAGRAAATARRCVLLLAVVAGMVGLSFASVPLYRLFCAGDRLWRHDAARRGRAEGDRRGARSRCASTPRPRPISAGSSAR